ncbi:MAG: Hsp20/alpha crystallin family protein [Bacteriovoracaceae bacterium]
MKYVTLIFLTFFSLGAQGQTDEDLQNMSKEELIKRYKQLKQQEQRAVEEDFGFGQIFKQMNKSFKNLFNDPFLRGLEEDDFGGIGIRSDLNIKQYEKDNNYIIEIDTTSIDQESLKIDIKAGIISVKGKTRIEKKNQQGGGQSYMQYESSFSKSFPIPRDADEEKVQIKNEQQSVKIIFPKKKTGKMI